MSALKYGLTLAILLLTVAPVAAQTPCPEQAGSAFQVLFDDARALNVTGYRVWIDGVQVGPDLLPSALVGGTVTVPTTPAGGTHVLEASAFGPGGEARSAPCTFTISTAPPPPPPPQGTTAGSTTIGSQTDTNASGFLNGSRIVLTGSLAVTSMAVHVGSVDALAANRLYALAIYTDVAGQPGMLVLASAAGTLVANAWNTVPLVVSLPAGVYWLMFATNGTTPDVNNLHYTVGTLGASAWSTAVPFGSWPAAFPGDMISDAVYSLYATADAPLVRLTPVNLRITK
jgi:hypothetical protein